MQVVAVGYEVKLDDFADDLKRMQMYPAPGQNVYLALYYGSGSVNAPILKDDAQLRKWKELHPATCRLQITMLFAGGGIVFGEFTDEDGVKFLGPLLNPKRASVMAALQKSKQFLKCDIKSHSAEAAPYLFEKALE